MTKMQRLMNSLVRLVLLQTPSLKRSSKPQRLRRQDEDDSIHSDANGSNDNDDDVFFLLASFLEIQSSCIAGYRVGQVFIYSLLCSLARLQT